MFKKLFGKEQNATRTMETLKEESNVNLDKAVVSLDKTLVSLEKKTGVSLAKHKAKVAVALDYSGSMMDLYSGGKIQEVLSKLMPLALKFDDDGQLDVWLFSNDCKRVASMDINNYSTYVKDIVNKSGYRMGGTSYSPVLKDIMDKYFEEEKSTSNIPSFVIYITDGENNDAARTTEIVRKSAEENIFIQFVEIGNERFKYLSELDDLDGREVDNTGFIKVKDMTALGEEELYALLLDQYPDWVKNSPHRV